MNLPVETPIRLAEEDLSEGRFSRFNLIAWWNQDKLRTARIVVIGAGALGNEIIKNLALLGIGNVVVIDMDRIEESNLSRSVLFRGEDIGTYKATSAVAAANGIFGEMRIQAITENVIHSVGLGVFLWADVILAGLDNREARLWINRCAWKLGRPWIDGAIEGINGIARVFLPGKAPCYECTLGETDWQILNRRLSCALLSREDMDKGKVPTTPTTSSVIAGIQVQEALKFLHNLPVLGGKAFVFEGLNHTSYVVEYTENPDCMSHEEWPEPVRYPGDSLTTLGELLDFAREQFGSEPVSLEFSRDVVAQLSCPACDESTDIYKPLGSVPEEEGICPRCGTVRRVVTRHSVSGEDAIHDRSIRDTGLPPYDIFLARSRTKVLPILIAGDEAGVMGAVMEQKRSQP